MTMLQLTISQMARRVGLNAHTLRYYERIGLVPNPGRARNGHRRYSEEDVAWIGFLCRLRDIGMPINEMKAYADLRAKGPGTAMARREILQKHQQKIIQRIADLNASLEELNTKIATYRAMEQQAAKPKATHHE